MNETLAKIKASCDALEECYEFLLGYAAQGLASDAGNASSQRLRRLLGGAAEAAANLPREFAEQIRGEAKDAEERKAFLTVLQHDAAAAHAAMRLVLAQTGISSQLVDNLNASIHLRALLTDIFLLDEVLGLHKGEAAAKR